MVPERERERESFNHVERPLLLAAERRKTTKEKELEKGGGRRTRSEREKKWPREWPLGMRWGSALS